MRVIKTQSDEDFRKEFLDWFRMFNDYGALKFTRFLFDRAGDDDKLKLKTIVTGSFEPDFLGDNDPFDRRHLEDIKSVSLDLLKDAKRDFDDMLNGLGPEDRLRNFMYLTSFYGEHITSCEEFDIKPVGPCYLVKVDGDRGYDDEAPDDWCGPFVRYTVVLSDGYPLCHNDENENNSFELPRRFMDSPFFMLGDLSDKSFDTVRCSSDLLTKVFSSVDGLCDIINDDFSYSDDSEGETCHRETISMGVKWPVYPVTDESVSNLCLKDKGLLVEHLVKEGHLDRGKFLRIAKETNSLIDHVVLSNSLKD